MHLETELMGTVRERAEDEAINVFARNLHDLLPLVQRLMEGKKIE